MKKTAVNPYKQIVGRWGESCAADFLEENGYLIISRNVRTPEGEIDLIAQKGDFLVFVEVKTRTNDLNGYPEEAVTEEKLEHMVNSAEYYLAEHADFSDHWRVDVIAVTGKVNGSDPQIEWFEDAA